MPGWLVKAERQVVDDGVQLSAVGFERANRLAPGDRQPPDFGMTCGLLTASLR
jgi:hypothetical protein